MSEMNLMPAMDTTNPAWAAGDGALLGSWFGNGGFGWNGGWGRGNGAVAAGAFETTVVMDNLNQLQNSAMTNNAMAQGFAGLNTAISNAGYENQLALGNLSRQNSECCCAIQNAIHSEGEATRGLIQANFINSLQTQLCDAKSKIGSLESQMFTNASNAAQTRDIVGAILPHLKTATPA